MCSGYWCLTHSRCSLFAQVRMSHRGVKCPVEVREQSSVCGFPVGGRPAECGEGCLVLFP